MHFFEDETVADPIQNGMQLPSNATCTEHQEATAASHEALPKAPGPAVAHAASSSSSRQPLGESAPLLQRSSTIVEDRQQFQRERREAAQRAVTQSGSIMGGIIVFFAITCSISLTLFACWVEVKSWLVLITYWSEPCDRALSSWLLLRNMLLWAPRFYGEDDPRQQRFSRFVTAFAAIWLLFGLCYSSQAVTCPKTNPELFNWVRFVVFYNIGLIALSISINLIILSVVVFIQIAITRGWMRNPNAAKEGTLENLETVEYDSALFAPTGLQSDRSDAALGECCCCMEAFGPDQPIAKTPCDHYFHRNCLAQWLALAKTCPLCRLDLDVACSMGSDRAA